MFILTLAAFALRAFVPNAIAEDHVAELTNSTGTVFYTPKNGEAEAIIPTKKLYAGDFLRTSNDSSAVVSMLLDKTFVRLRQHCTLQILPPQRKSGVWLNLLHGALYFFSRGDSSEPGVATPDGDAAFVGTEVVITVESNQTVMIVLNGTGTFTNQYWKTNLVLQSREMCTFSSNQPPIKTQLVATNLVQWWLSYPAVVDMNDLVFSDDERKALTSSIAAYSSGDLPNALSLYPGYPSPSEPQSDSGKIYLAALYLAAGEVDKTENLLREVPGNPSVAQSLLWLIAAVQGNVSKPPAIHTSASEWLGLSYYFQARRELDKALDAARQSVSISTNFAFGWERLAELQFSFGRIPEAKAALDKSLELAPCNAQAHSLKGFLCSAENDFAGARYEFDEAIHQDPNLGEAWLGRGLVRIRTGDAGGGRADLKMAAVLEPSRSSFRSYLGKSFADAGEDENASLELARAEGLDPNDPTPWLYSALLKRDQNRINEAVEDLEKSVALNTNRAVYRSQLLLDQDKAVRSANLAAIYQDAGMTEVSVNEAGNAVMSDYANYSAHLFLANSYNALRDPNLLTLRYETATSSEYLLANLLSPVGGTALSPYVSQQEYSRLFEQDRPGFSSDTTYLSSGDWVQQASLYGSQKNTGYAVDTYYRSHNGAWPNSDLEQKALSVELKQQLTSQDSIYGQATFSDDTGGDVRQLYNWRTNTPVDRYLRTSDHQTPNLFLGYHHEWSPGVHTLFLAARLEDKFTLTDKNVQIPGVLVDGNGTIVDSLENHATNRGFQPGVADEFDSLKSTSDFVAYSAELQQIAQISRHTVIVGGRYQDGSTQTEASEARAQGAILPGGPFAGNQKTDTSLRRLSLYGYDQWRVFDPLWLTAGVTFDQLRYPKNVDLAPISSGEQTATQLSPKAGFVWTPCPQTTIRGAFTRSLGGLFYDSSIRLEPVQIAGFNQAYRSLIPESVEGATPGSKFETFDLALEQKLKSRIYLTLQLELLDSDARRDSGAFIYVPAFPGHYTGQTTLGQKLSYEEHSLTASLNKLVGRDWSLGVDYKVSHADLKTHYIDLPSIPFPATHEAALLHTLDLHAIFNHPSGFFAEGQALWRGQSNFNDDSNLAGAHFWQANLYAGYRFPRRRAEITLGLLNLTGQNYHLNPLNLYAELPRDRTLFTSLKLNF